MLFTESAWPGQSTWAEWRLSVSYSTWAIAIVMPRSRSSGALSIWSKGVKSARPLSAWRLVIAAVRVVLPWSMCPIVPTFTWGLFRSNFFLPICPSPSRLLARHPGDDLLRDVGRDLVVGVQLHRAARRTALGLGTQVGHAAEQLGQRHDDPHDLLPRPLVDVLDAAAARGHVAHHLAEELLGRGDLELHHGLEQHGAGLARAVLERHRPGDLERHLRGVHLVERAVDQRGAEVNQRVARQHAVVHRLLDALVDGRDVLSRDRAARDLIDELVAAAGAGRLEVEHDVAVLAATAGLARELEVDLVDEFRDRLAIGDLRPPDVRVDAELAAQTVDDDVQVQLAHP